MGVSSASPNKWRNEGDFQLKIEEMAMEVQKAQRREAQKLEEMAVIIEAGEEEHPDVLRRNPNRRSEEIKKRWSLAHLHRIISIISLMHLTSNQTR